MPLQVPKTGTASQKVRRQGAQGARSEAYFCVRRKPAPSLSRGGTKRNAASRLLPEPSVFAGEDPGIEGVEAVLPRGEGQGERHDLPPLRDHPFGRLPDVPLGVAVRPDAGEMV